MSLIQKAVNVIKSVRHRSADHTSEVSESESTSAFPDGHFYSPIVDPSSIEESRIWPPPNEACQPLGIDFSPDSHENILREIFPRYIAEYSYPENAESVQSPTQFYTQNSQFSWLDSRLLFVLLNHWKPKRLIEVGSGFSSLLAADVSHRMMSDAMDVICIEPYPREFLETEVPGITQVVKQKVEDLPFDFFSSLQSGDVLFIDSSHVSKTGSDVNYLFFEVLPRLAAGVRIHVHDIFFPLDYPKSWVLEEKRSWNEQYVLRALLMYTNAFRVLFGSAFAFWKYPELVGKALDLESGVAFGGGSFWIEKTKD